MGRRNQMDNIVSYGNPLTDNPPPSPPTMFYDYPATASQYHPMYIYPVQTQGSLDMMHPALGYQYQYPYQSMLPAASMTTAAQRQANSFAPSLPYYYPNFFPPANQLPPSATFPFSPSPLGSTSFDLSKPRGPPRKPLQTGHAIWVGNLPPLTCLEDLLKAFGNSDIVSIFLIQKTSCAFVNYSSERAVKQVLRGAKFNMRGRNLLVKEQVDNREEDNVSVDKNSDEIEESYDIPDVDPQNRYFICKSLTVEDLEVSTTLGIWSTQAHVEKTLNDAFKSAKNVYLIFSANKTGEFFGYARMTSSSKPQNNANLTNNQLPTNRQGSESPLSQHGSSGSSSPSEASSNLSWSTMATSHPLDKLLYHEPRTTLTPADASIPIPAGRIVDDSSRGTLFWEYIPKQSKQLASFEVEWINMHPVQFRDVAHLRNRFNMNKPLKVAKDGTEIEPKVGATLLAMFP